MEDKRKIRAFTFVELMIVMSVSVLVFGIIYNFYYQISHQSQITVDEMELIRAARLFIDACSRDLLKAVKILKITPRKIVFLKFKDKFSINEQDEYQKVSYVLSSSNNVLVRIEGGKIQTLIRNIRIKSPLFQGFIENVKEEKFYPYDEKTGSNLERNKISYVRLRITLTKRKYTFSLVNGVCCRRIHFHNLEKGLNILQ